ncbi:SANT and BTB domain regulator of class switch recombination isoform X2 [Brachyhypopomus gauderio]
MMNRLCSVNNNFPYDNNLLVLDMVLSSLWAVQQPINWDNVARLVPGFTPKECSRRFDELKSAGSLPLVDDQCNMVTSGSASETLSAYIRSTLLDLTGETGDPRTNQSILSVSGVTVTHAERGVRPDTEGTAATEGRDKEDGGKSPTMVIHVCDEAKNLKQDFECPRHLLVKEMRYFSEYLSMDAQRWEEVDISVHCDIQIFDWLMSYVKRNCEEPEPGKHVERPKLEPSNVISILISSEFLKMDTLVEECIQFCHKHMSAVVATPCNMSCISSALVCRIAQLFTHNEAHDIKDKKDKFKSKLFQKKIEKLFVPDHENQDSPGSAATLYRCGLCQKLLTKDTERKIPCVPGKLNVDSRGNIVYTHSRHKGWDVHEFLNSLYEELKSWVLVYWRIWGTINVLTCSCCKQVFLCCELAQCRYHPQSVVFPGVGAERGWHGTGFYPCCNQRALRFDPTTMPHGCKLRDHVVCPDSGDCVDNVNSVQTRILNDLLLHRDVVCVNNPPASESLVESPAGGERVQDCDIMLGPGVRNVQRGGANTAFSLLKNWSLQLRQQSLLSEDEEYTTGSEVTEDEVGDEEDPSKKQVAKKTKKSGKLLRRQVSSPSIQSREKTIDKVPSRDSTPFTVSVQMSKWDSTRSMRFNQDAQREEDQRRMVDIIDHLTKMRFGDLEQSKSKDTKEVEKSHLHCCVCLAGGIYSRLEAQFKSCTQSSSKHSSSDKTLRLKTRSGPSRPT